MKRMPKKHRQSFAKDAAALIASLGFQPLPADEPGYDYGNRTRRAMTDAGPYLVYLPDPETCDGDDLYGRFTEAARARNYVDCNPFTGKWNVIAPDSQACLEVFECRMRKLNVRPPTESESAEWAKQDALDAAERAIFRASLRAQKENA